MEQVEGALGQPCKLLQKSVTPPIVGSEEHASYECSNSDGSKVSLVLIDGKVTNIMLLGQLPSGAAQ